jgi:seryl-tRNA synthetase
MIDVKMAREQPDAMRAALARKGTDAVVAFDALLETDRVWRECRSRVDTLRALTSPKGKPSPEQIEELARTKGALRAAEEELRATEARRDELLGVIPNPPEPAAPDGTSDEDAVELRRGGVPRDFGFPIRDHTDLAGFDTERGARLSGSRFAYRVGAAALVELSLYRYALDTVARHGYVPMLPPVLVREEAMHGTGFLPTDEVNIYRLEAEDLYLTGTSEVALAGFHMGELLDAGELPLRYAGYSTCFRREAGAAGKDTRGVFRVHQFDKVEMYSYVEPSASAEEHARILAIEEEIVGGLGLPYRVVDTAAGDLGPSAARKFDIEAWFPSEGRYREITSCSNTTDYQSRRLRTRVRREHGTVHPHTLNGTAMTARFLLALLENLQQENGSVPVPPALVAVGAPAVVSAAASRR